MVTQLPSGNNFEKFDCAQWIPLSFDPSENYQDSEFGFITLRLFSGGDYNFEGVVEVV